MTAPFDAAFVPETVHKRDIFSETVSGHLAGHPDDPVVLRRLDTVPWVVRPLAWALARREIRGLKAAEGIEGTPLLIRVDKTGLLRSWTKGTPLHLARPKHPEWYADARRLLRELRARGVSHNDLAKPQNWLMTPEGRAAVIDFQLASVHRRRGRLFRLAGYEDLRHLMKQKRAFAPALMTATERRIVARRSLPARIWRASGKRLYNFVTRRLMNWSDGEGTEGRLETDGAAIVENLKAHPNIREVVLTHYSLPAKGVGIYGFAETDLDEAALRALAPARRIEKLQPVPALPRRADGSVREDVLQLIATNQLDELAVIFEREPELRARVDPIIAARLNLTDRFLRKDA